MIDSLHTQADERNCAFDLKVFSTLIVELNICRRNISAYPKGHPFLLSSLTKFLSTLDELLEFRHEITIGVAKDTILLGSSFLDKTNPIYRDFAKSLSERGIALMTITRGVTIDEMIDFCEVLSLKPERVFERGGVRQLVEQSGALNIRVREIDVSLLHISEGPADDSSGDISQRTIWERFIGGMADGLLSPEGTSIPSRDIDPEDLAAFINGEFERGVDHIQTYDQAIATFMRDVEKEGMASPRSRDSVTNIGRLIKALHPDIKKYFLNNSFRALGDNRSTAESILSGLPDDIILEALHESANDKEFAPPVILSILQKLSAGSTGSVVGQFNQLTDRFTSEEMKEKFRILFREFELDRFVPRDYQQTLKTILESERLSLPERQHLEDLKQGFSLDVIEHQVTSVIMELLSSPAEEWLEPVLERNLVELCTYYLDTGEFNELTAMHKAIVGRMAHGEAKTGRVHLLQLFESEQFVQDVLNAINVWGKPKFHDVSRLVREVGRPFIVPLLTRLAEEESISLRRFYMDLIIGFGNDALEPAVRLLYDRRWFFVRNIVIIVRTIGNTSYAKHLHRLKRHTHPRVRQELLKTLIQFGDPEGERLLLDDLRSEDPEIRIAAIQAAGKCSGEKVLQELLAMLEKGGLSGTEFETKRLILNTLAEIGNPDVLPGLERVMRSRQLFNRTQHSRLKHEILKTLDRYPPADTVQLLNWVAGSGHDELAPVARNLLRTVSGEVTP